MGLKVFSEQFRDSVLQLNLKTPPEIVAGLSDLMGNGAYYSYLDSLGKDPSIRSTRQEVTVKDPGDITSTSPVPRAMNLAKNMTTPQDVFLGIEDLTPSQAVAQQYLGGRGEDVVLSSNSVTDPGDIDQYAEVELKKLLSKNIHIDQNDPSESNLFVFGQGYTYSTLVSTIGQPTLISNNTVQNLASVTLNPNITPETQYFLALQQNRYMPVEPNTFEVTVDLLEAYHEPYVDMNTGTMTRFQPEEYQPSQFLSGSAAVGTLDQLISDPAITLKTDTVLMNIAAMELKFNFENRILNALERETIGKSYIDEALTNPLTAINILRDPANNLFEKDWTITTSPNFLTKAALLAARITGVDVPVNIIPDDVVLMPGNFGNVPKIKDPSQQLIQYTSGGQLFAMNANLAFNKYTPIFAGVRNDGQYIGSNDTDPLSLISDDNGNAVYSNERMSKDYDPNMANMETSQYGKLASNFAWIGKNRSTVATGVEDISSYAKYQSLFKKGSILDNTQNILNTLDDSSDVAKTAIDQVKKKFDDGYHIISRGSGVLGGLMTPANGSKSKNTYKVPDRNQRDQMAGAELCRVWTKDRPYSKISTAVRFSELIRKERNSVIDRFSNYNIFPSDLNVNEGYGRPGTGPADATVEAFGEKRARKYMLSLENLAWRDSVQFTELPACEKGPNGGRVMWFPPYDIKISDDDSANWTSHSFLGRPEPIYTYNNTERSGSLSFKIVVDHPTILNTLVKYELANLSDAAVDEVLASFWSGCVEYDIFELARIYGVLSDQDISYFKDVIAGLDPVKSNADNTSSADSALKKQATTSNEKAAPKSDINGHALYFENDAPYPEDAWGNIDNIAAFFDSSDDAETFFAVRPYDEYYKIYESLASVAIATGSTSPSNIVLSNGKINKAAVLSAHAYKSVIYPNKDLQQHYKDAADFVDYASSIGNLSRVHNNFFDDNAAKFNGLAKQKQIIEQDIASSKYDGCSLTINMAAYSSPLFSDSYNTSLSDRRFRSVGMWIAAVVLANKTPKTQQGIAITKDNVADMFPEGVTSVTFFKNEKEKVTIIKGDQSGITDAKVRTDLKSEFGLPDPYKLEYKGTVYNCYIDPVKVTNDTDGNLQPGDKAVRRHADLVCADLSAMASRARRVDVTVQAQIIPKKPDATPVQVVQSNPKVTGPSVTKREVAQRLLNKLITECDYFEYLKETSPTAYNGLKEKLKFFTPAFHAITPEGLNARLTFLKQCLRPGDTIKSGSESCDAVNTSFGKPPICILRIGDLYNTKVVINNLNISYEPLVWDLNPEGIGAQPMLADVNMSFKYIGGSGLRKYVDELQNALTFNYFANTDVYDDRTFANTNAYERNLQNLETDFFNGDQLDIAAIVPLLNITPQTPSTDTVKTMIGEVVETLQPHLPGGTYSNAVAYSPSTTYDAGTVVFFTDGYTYQRLTANTSSQNDPTDSTIWKQMDAVPNYGEKPYIKEYGRNYMNFMKVDYQKAFKTVYKNYVQSLGLYAKVYEDFYSANTSPILMSFLMRQTFGNVEASTDPNYNDSLIYAPTGTTLAEYTNNAKDRNYKTFDQLSSIPVDASEMMRLHLYPQDKFFRMPNATGSTIDYGQGKFDPGAFNGIYMKDKKAVFDQKDVKLYVNHFVGTMSQKIDNDLLKFISQSPSVFSAYMSEFSENDKNGMRDYLKSKLADYQQVLNSYFEASNADISALADSIELAADGLVGLGMVLNGSDGLGDKIFTEVAPNGTTINNVTSVFGYDPYNNFPIVQYNLTTDGAAVIGNVRTYPNETIKGIVSGRTASADAYAKMIRLGNGPYAFKQQAGSSVFSDAGFVSGPYFPSSRLPILKNLDGGVAIDQNTLNVDYNGGVGLLVGDGTKVTSPYSGHTTMTSVFEKMNFEMLEFSNKTLSVLMNDSIADNTGAINTLINNTELRQQLTTYIQANVDGVDPNSVSDIVTKMVGAGELHALTLSTTNTDLQTAIGAVNSNLSFNFTVTKEYLDSKNKSGLQIPTGLQNYSFAVNYYDELLLVGFYQSLMASGSLADDLKGALNANTVIAPANLSARQQKDYITNKKVVRAKVADDLVTQLQAFLDSTKTSLTSLDTLNKTKISDFSKNVRSILFNDNSGTSIASENFDALADKLMKKPNGTEYTLLMRQSTSVAQGTKSLLNKLYNA